MGNKKEGKPGGTSKRMRRQGTMPGMNDEKLTKVFSGISIKNSNNKETGLNEWKKHEQQLFSGILGENIVRLF